MLGMYGLGSRTNGRLHLTRSDIPPITTPAPFSRPGARGERSAGAAIDARPLRYAPEPATQR